MPWVGCHYQARPAPGLRLRRRTHLLLGVRVLFAVRVRPGLLRLPGGSALPLLLVDEVMSGATRIAH
jgi:hypothetical protein